MIELDAEQQRARTWFESLRDRICSAFESIEREAGNEATFDFTPWHRDDDPGGAGGGGVRGVMKGKVFEKVGVNVSTVGGAFNPEFDNRSTAQPSVLNSLPPASALSPTWQTRTCLQFI